MRPNPTEDGRPAEVSVPGVRGLDHTADIGLRVDAPDLATLFERAATGTFELVFGGSPVPAQPVSELDPEPFRIEAPDRALLLRAWLRELLNRFDDTGEVPVRVDRIEIEAVDRGDERQLRLNATLRSAPASREPIREIKGVTLHRLSVERGDDGGWSGRVIFDV